METSISRGVGPGDVVYKARMTFEHSNAVVTKISGQREPGTSEDPAAVVDFLIKSHIFGLAAPHPLPETAEAPTDQLAMWSFARYGRRGLFGTKSDVKQFRVVQNDDGRWGLNVSTEI
jgi:hypothetical protein